MAIGADVVDDFEDAGLISETEWESPLNGFDVEWSGPWSVNESMSGPTPHIIGRWEEARTPVYSSSYGDHIDLWNEDDSAVLRITDRYGDPVGLPTASEFVEFSMTEFPLDATSTQIMREISDDKVVVVYLVADTRGDIHISYNEFVVPETEAGDRLLWTQLLAPIDRFERAYESVVDDVSNSAASFGDILDASDIADAARSNDTLVTPADLGVTSPSTWEGPFGGSSVEWSSNWVFDGSPRNWRIDENSQSAEIKLLGSSGSPNAHQLTISTRPNTESLTAQQVAFRTARYEEYMNNDILLRRHGESSVVLTLMPTTVEKPVVIYDEVFITGDGEFIVEVHLSFEVGKTEADYLHFAGELTVDGIPVGVALSVDEIIDATENADPLTVLGTRTIDAFQEFRNSLLYILDTYGDAGMTWTNEYESPSHEYTVTWDSSWQLNEPTDANGVKIPAVTTSSDGDDFLSLWNRRAFTIMEISSQATNDAPIDVLTGSLGWCDELDWATCDVVLTTQDDESAAIVVLIEAEDGRMWLHYLGGTMIDDDTIEMVMIQATGDSFASGYAAAPDTVMVNGEPPILYFDDDEIADLG
jgi:hypothetical protein